MVKVYATTDTYDYTFPETALAYMLRYPNPFSTHVLSTDTISRSYDPVMQRLTTVRLHLKKSKLPPAVLRLLPGGALRSSGDGAKDGQTRAYILEKSVVDVKEGVMETESRNLDWTGVLSVVEQQTYRRISIPVQDALGASRGATDVLTTVTLHSHVGEAIRKKRAKWSTTYSSAVDDPTTTSSEGEETEEDAKPGFLRSWTTSSIQRSIELIGLRRAEGSQPKAKEGMKVVLERLRRGGLVAVLEGMRRDREELMMP
ncbi:hypothetical protein LTR66_002854 [Elasticomyces elasticus]|nr:hypothetical protein LTR66_002854 [Elasticomyces elasticus]